MSTAETAPATAPTPTSTPITTAEPTQPAATATTTPATQPVAEPAASATPPADPLAPKFAALARRDKELKAAQQAAAAREAALAEREAKLKAFEESQSRWQDDPIDFLDKSGVSIEKLADLIAAGPKPKESKEVAELRKQVEALAKERAEAQEREKAQQVEAARANYRKDMADFVAKNADKYELLAEKGEAGQELLFEVVQQHWRKTFKDTDGQAPEMLTFEQAADWVEKSYEREVETTLSSKAKKIQTMLQKLGVPVAQAQAAAQAATTGQPAAAAAAAPASTPQTAPAADDEKPLTVDDWVALAEQNRGHRRDSMLLTNDVVSVQPPRRTIDGPEQSEFEKAAAMIKFVG